MDKRAKSAFLDIILPAGLIVLLFAGLHFFVFLPALKQNAVQRKKEMLREVCQPVLNTLSYLHRESREGRIAQEAAQAQAVQEIRSIRYGPTGQDYFWITDLAPRMVMHPYRPDLEGENLAEVVDAAGKPLFREFARIAADSGSGYVDYLWQWHADPGRITSKLSYVTLFEPWGWVVGTGVYLDDIRQEAAEITRQLIIASLGVLTLVTIFAAYLAHRTLLAERRRQQAEHEVWKQQQQLIQADKLVSLGTLVAGVAHEINNPNGLIMLNNALLKDVFNDALPLLNEQYERNGDFLLGGMNYSDIRKEMPALLDDVNDASHRIRRIVDGLKDFARVGSNLLDEQVDINALLERTAGLARNTIQKATDNFSIVPGENIPPVQGNSQRLGQVVLNLLLNACEALPDPGKAIILSSSYDPETNSVIISVADEGVGIPEDQLAHITDPFYTTKQNQGGTGLGLSVSSGIVEDHHGRLEFSSNSGAGTIAKIVLPAGKPTEKEQA